MTAILGLNAFHGDSAAALLVDGQLKAAAEEERFTRVKHWAGFPSHAIRYCLARSGLAIRDVDIIALNHDPRAAIFRRLGYVARGGASLGAIAGRLLNRRQKRCIPDLIVAEIGEGFAGCLFPVEHHLAHLASAFFASRFEDAAAVSVDGFGDFASAAWGLGAGPRLTVDDRIYFPHSLGILYQAVTQFLGFTSYGDEYKVMGLASYGEPSYLSRMRKLVAVDGAGRYRLDLAYFQHASARIDFSWTNGEPTFGALYSPRMVELLGPGRAPGDEITKRHRDLARSLQAAYEEAFFALLRAVHAKYGVDRIALSGGCAMNSVANGKVYASTPFRRMYVQAAAGDAGGAIGAAMVAWSRHATGAEGAGARPAPMDHAYWGPGFSAEACDAALQARGVAALPGIRIVRASSEDDLCARVARAIAEGKVVGWFQGAMEWGPRALGSRSILGDPRRGDMKELLNKKIKRRESFRPFAPSILREAVADWFEVDDDVPFMTQVYPIRVEKRSLVPAVTHVDGTGRLQTVTEAQNPLYHRLISRFAGETGVPMLLNTSFNESEPIVCTPAEALDCFLRTNMDCLALGSTLVTREA